MLRYVLAALVLTGCNANHGGAVTTPFIATGVWSSPAGYRLSIREDRTYEFCDSSSCYNGKYVEETKDYVVLKDFFALPSTARFVELAELEPPCRSDSCGRLSSGIEVHATDLQFTSTVAAVDRARKCGERVCTIMGNVETPRGILYKVPEPSGSGSSSQN